MKGTKGVREQNYTLAIQEGIIVQESQRDVINEENLISSLD